MLFRGHSINEIIKPSQLTFVSENIEHFKFGFIISIELIKFTLLK